MNTGFKYISIFSLLVSLSLAISGQTNDASVKIVMGNSILAEPLTVTRLSDKLYSIRVSINEILLKKRNSSYGIFYQMEIPMSSFLGNTDGQPSLPTIAKLLEIPENSVFKIQIDSILADTILLNSYEGYKVYPFQSSQRKNMAATTTFRYDSTTYKSDFYLGDSLIRIESLGIMRGKNLERLVVSPISYNPVENKLKVVKYFKALVEIQSQSSFATNPSKFASAAFSKLMDSKFSVANQISTIPSKHPMKYLILADSMFKKSLKPFIKWKTEEGYKVVVVYKGAPGVGTTPQQIKAYLTNLYNSATADDPAPTYLLIVGDNEQVPAFTSPRYGHATDLYYATFDGPDDYYPDMFYGRFSAIDSTSLTNQIDKTLEYEKYRFPDPTFLDSAMLISTGNDANGYDYGNGQINYIANNYANPAHGLHSNTYLYPNSYYRSPDVLLHFNTGCSFINYTGHGDVTFWYSPYITSAEINALTNYHKYPLVISNGCITNYFTYPVCFGEALLRGKNIGAIGHIGCTDDSYWDEDYYWATGVRPIIPNPVYSPTGLGAFDRIFHTHNEPQNEWYPAQGQMNFAGNLAVVESGSRRAQYYWEIYTLLGDPSLKVYFGRPDSLNSSFPSKLPVGSTQIGIYAEPGSYTGLSLRDSLIDGGAVDSSGFILLNFPSVTITDSLMLVISKQNRKPVIATIHTYSPVQAYLEFKGFSMSSESKTANGKADYGESMKLNIHLQNAGATISKNIKITLTSSDSLVSIKDSVLHCSTILPGKDTSFANAFNLAITPFIEDQHEINFVLDITDSLANKSRFYIVLIAEAPSLSFGEPSYEDKLSGNGNARPDPGETLNLVIPVTNSGHSTMDPATFIVSGQSSALLIPDTLLHLPSIMPDSTVWLKLPFHLDSSVVPGLPLTISLRLDTLSIHTLNKIVIRPGAYSEDFETGNLKYLPWKSTTAIGWYTTNKFSLHGNYSARSGKIGDNQTTDMEVILYVTDTGRIQFEYKVSSEDYYDFFYFYVDNKQLKKVSGQSGLQFFSDSISVGWHSFLWRYQKDVGYSYGDDCVWIDNIMFPPSVIIPASVIHPYYDGAMASILYPSTDSSFSGSIQPVAIIKNKGNLPIEPKKISYKVNALPAVTENLFAYLSPGDSLIYQFTTLLNLPDNQTCSLRTYLSTPGDSIHSNDTASVVFKNLYNFAEKFPMSVGLKVYPNPAGDYIFFRLPVSVKEGRVEVFDIEGRLFYSTDLTGGQGNAESSIDLRGLPAGTCLISVNADGKMYVQKFVKK